MKKYISTILCIALALCLFGCSNGKATNTQPISNDITSSADTAGIVFFETKHDADAALICHNGTTIMIDTGEKTDAKRIAKYLAENEIGKIDCLIFSHFDQDHCGGAAKMMKDDSISIGEILHPAYIKDSKDATKVLELADKMGIPRTVIDEEQSIDINGIALSLYPAKQSTYANKDSNNSSLVVMAEVLGKRALFTGDCEGERVGELMASNTDYTADILKLMYHGRAIANESAMLDRIQPSHTIITGDKDDKDVRTNILCLQSQLGEYHYTCNGTISIAITTNGITVTQ